YGETKGLVKLGDRKDRMALLAWPRGRTSSRMGSKREKLSSREGRKRWTLAIAGRRSRLYRLQASLTTLKHPFAPCAVEVRHGSLRAWKYDRRTRVLRATLRGKRPTLIVRG